MTEPEKNPYEFMTCPACGKDKAQISLPGLLRCEACRIEIFLYEQVEKGNFSFVSAPFIRDLKNHGYPHIAETIKNARDKNLWAARTADRKRMSRIQKKIYTEKYSSKEQ